MPTVTQSGSRDYLDAYDGYDRQQVGLGLLNPNIYASPAYQKKKVKNMMIGGISSCNYAGFEVDPTPLILVLGYETSYNTVMCINLNYLDALRRKAVMKYVLESNAARIKSNLPILIDWHGLQRAVPDIQYATRRLKVVGIGLKETYSLSEWPTLVKKTSRYDGYYKVLKEGS